MPTLSTNGPRPRAYEVVGSALFGRGNVVGSKRRCISRTQCKVQRGVAGWELHSLGLHPTLHIRLTHTDQSTQGTLLWSARVPRKHKPSDEHCTSSALLRSGDRIGLLGAASSDDCTLTFRVDRDTREEAGMKQPANDVKQRLSVSGVQRLAEHQHTTDAARVDAETTTNENTPCLNPLPAQYTNPATFTRGTTRVQVRLPAPFVGNDEVVLARLGGSLQVPPGTPIAGFDFDGTLSNRRASNGVNKWRSTYWDHLFASSRNMVRALAAKGFAIVVLTNESVDRYKNSKPMEEQLGPKCQRVAGWAADVGIPVLAVVAISKLAVSGGHSFHKGPKGVAGNAAMWHTAEALLGMQSRANPGSFFVGDAAGRDGDHGDDDRRLAASAGVPFYTEDEFFLGDPLSLI